MSALVGFLGGFVWGLFALLWYIVHRMMTNDDWDKSNMTNALRLLSHVCLHPADFGGMFYVRWDDDLNRYVTTHRPFWYVTKDELSEVVETRPPK